MERQIGPQNKRQNDGHTGNKTECQKECQTYRLKKDSNRLRKTKIDRHQKDKQANRKNYIQKTNIYSDR